MKINNRSCAKLISLTIGFSASLALVSCETPPPPPPPPVIVQAPAPIPQVQLPQEPPPLVVAVRPIEERVNDAIVRAAGNHADLMRAINQLAYSPITSPEGLNGSMDNAARVYSPGLAPSFIGFGGMIGAQNAEFVEGVRRTARYDGLDTVVYRLYQDANYAATLPGANSAGADIKAAWNSDIGTISSAASNVKQQSYDLQKQAGWKKLKTDDRKARIGAIKQATTLRFDPSYTTKLSLAEIGTIRPSDYDGPQRRQAFWQVYGRTSAPRTSSFVSQANGKMTRKALTLSALEILGATGPASKDWINGFMISPALNRCTVTARLNTEQCLAAGYFKYEDAFCVAEHELKEISTCLSTIVR